MKIKMVVTIDRCKKQQTIEIDDIEIEGMNEDEIDEYISKEYLELFVWESVDYCWEKVE